MSAAPGPAEPSDAQLVAGVLAGDRDAFAAIYDRYGDRLYDFCHALLRHREEAADAVADTFVLFAERVGQLRDPSRLRPWLYAVARSEGLRRLKARRRFVPDAETALTAMPDHAAAGPERAAEQAALRDLVWNAAAGLADRDRALLDLHLRQGLDGADLGEAMGVSTQHAYVLLSRLRAQVERSLGALLIARLGRSDCTTLDGLLTGWDGRFSPLVRKRVARHVDNCDVCSQRRRLVASPWALLSTVALVPAPLALRDRVVQTRLVAAHPPTPGPAGTGGAGGSTRTRVQAGAAVLTVLALGAIALLWPTGSDDNRTADAVSAPAPAGPVTPSTTGSSGQVESPVTAAPSAPGSNSAAPLLPGSLAVSTRTLDLGSSAVSSTVELTNTGDRALTWTATSSDRWLTTGPAGGRLGGRETAAVVVRADRTAVPEGTARGTVQIGWAGGLVPIVVTVTVQRPPQVGAPQISAARPASPGCAQPNRPAGRVPVTVAASDDTGLRSVILTWVQPDGSTATTPLRAQDTGWVGVAGPFPSPGTVTLRATATDVLGNTTTGPATRVQIDPCPR